MNKIKFVFLLVILSILAKANASDGNFSLSVSTDGKLILQRVQLLNADGYEKTITRGSEEFAFSNSVNRYGIYSMSVTWINPATKKTSGTNIQLFLKEGNTKLIFQGNSGKYIVTGASVTVQKNFEAFSSKDQAYIKRIMGYEFRLLQYQKSGNRKAAAELKDTLSETKNARNKNVFESYILQHPNDDLSLYAMRIYSSINMENPSEVKKLLSSLGKELQETEEIIEIKKDAEENEKFIVGVKAPDFTQADTNGVAVTLSSLRGKYVLVDFWASWCKPCRAQNPSMVRLYQKYKDKGFTILSVSLDSKREAWMKAIQADKLEWMNVSDLKFWKNDVAQQYKITHVPQNFLLDSQGVILGKNLNEDDLNDVLEKELVKSK
jgi:peroxiredoxin